MASSSQSRTPASYVLASNPTFFLTTSSRSGLFQMYNDFVADPSAPAFASIPSDDARALLALSEAASLRDKALEKTFLALSRAHYAAHVAPSMACAQRCGNMYTASLYGGLASLLATVPPADLRGSRIAMFAFGSGCAASFWAVRVAGDTRTIRDKMDLVARLDSVRVVPCDEFVEALKVRPSLKIADGQIADGHHTQIREKNHNAAPYQPTGSLDNLWPGTYYLESIDAKFRRKYAVVPEATA